MHKPYLSSIAIALLISGSALAQTNGIYDLNNKPTDGERLINGPALIPIPVSEEYTTADVNQLFARVFGMQQDVSLLPLDTTVDELGMTHMTFQQAYKGTPVEFGKLKVHFDKNGLAQTISGEYVNVADLSVQPGVTATAAFAQAKKAIPSAQSWMWDYPAAAREMNYSKPTGDLVVLPGMGENASPKLAYKFDMFAASPGARGMTYVDAQSGDILFYNAIIKHFDNAGHDGAEHGFCIDTVFEAVEEKTAMYATGTAATRYSGSRSITTGTSGGNYILADTGRKIYTRDAVNQSQQGYPYVNNYAQFTDNDNNWTSAEHAPGKDNAALDAHWGAERTYTYFQNKHNRNSYDGNGAQIRSYVHVDNNYDNAFWNGSVMSYGDGSSNGNEGNGFFDALTSLDVAAHEIGHAVTSFTADLAYQRESGGLNEGFSDIWGAAVEQFAKGNGNDAAPAAKVWLIGDEIDRRSGSAALRSMSNPTALGQPDTYGGQYWKNPNCGTPTFNNDYCGVHTNSGVLNYWFYLAVAGGSGTNDVGSSYSVSGIGMDKAAKIAYRTLNNYLSANSTFANARAAAIQSAKDLYGAGGAEEQAVTNAWHAVNVGARFVSNVATCNTTTSSFPSSANFNGNLSNWTNGGGDDFDWVNRSGGTPSNGTGPSGAQSGSEYIYMESSSPNFSSKRAIITSPCYNTAGKDKASVSFYTHMYGADNMGSLSLQIRVGNSTSWSNVWSRSGNQGNQWSQSTVNLDDYAGTRFQLRFNGITGTTWQGDMAVDNLRVTATTTPTGPSCATTVTSFPYGASFEGNLSGWNNATGDDFNWATRSGGTPSRDTGPASAQLGNSYVYVESSNPNFPNKVTNLDSPCFALNGANAEAKFSYHMYGAADMGNLKLQISVNGGAYSTIWTRSGNQTNNWYAATVDLSNYKNSTFKLRFSGTTGTTWQGDMAVDNFRIEKVSSDPCAGIAPWSSSATYSPGDLVTYNGNLFQRTATSWTNLGPCGASFTLVSNSIDASDIPAAMLGISVYPNPTVGILNIAGVDADATGSLQVVNMLGQTVINSKLQSQLDLSNLRAGIYMVSVMQDGVSNQFRVIKE